MVEAEAEEVEVSEEGDRTDKVTRYETTVGRALLSEILPPGLPFALLNRPLKKKEISRLINAAFRRCGLRETVIFADKLMQAGVTINRPPHDGHMAFIRTPDNISIELLQKGDALPLREPWASMPNTGSW